MALGVPLNSSAKSGSLRVLCLGSIVSLSFAFLGCTILGCRSDERAHAVANDERRPGEMVNETPVQAKAAADKPSTVLASPAVGPSSGTRAGSDVFLVGEQGGAIIARSLAVQKRVVVSSAAWWLYDEGHELVWTIYDHVLSVADLRTDSPPIPLATGLEEVGSIWVEWPEPNGSEHVREENACESFDAVEIKMRAKPALRLIASNEPRPLLTNGLSWLKAQAGRSRTRPSISQRRVGFPLNASRVSLPKQWVGCEDEQRCGRSAPFGSSHLQLVLVADKHGADCWQRSCLLFNPDTREFSSPPVIENSETLDLSTAPLPARWTSASEARPGICGPYYFDATGTAFLVRNYLCSVNGECQDLGATGIGWLEPGLVIGEPG
jgi:hypothetical protein